MMSHQNQRTSPTACHAPAAVTRPFRTPVRGHAFAARTPGASDPVPGQLARLVREPANPADRYAVGVWVAGRGGRWRIGYLDRLIAARLAPRLDDGATIAARIDGWTPEPDGRWRRPLLVLLPPGESASDGSADDPASKESSQHLGHNADVGRDDVPRREVTHEEQIARGAGTRGEGDTSAGLWGRPPGVSRRVLRPT